MKNLPDTTYRSAYVVLADGDYPSTEPALSILTNAEKVVCCDGAAVSYLEQVGEPYAIVGDCDSLSVEIKHKYASIIHEDKNQATNDLTKAVHFCVSQGAEEVVILGATGKREDHTLGNISLLVDYSSLIEVKMITDWGIFEPVLQSCRFESFPKQQVSIFCPDPKVKVTTVDLQFPLTEANLTAWWQGTLNETFGNSFGLEIEGGPVIVFRTFLPK